MSQQQPSFARIGKIFRTMANYAASAVGLSLITGAAFFFVVAGGHSFVSACIVIIVTLVGITFFRNLFLTHELMIAFQAVADDQNVLQFKMFVRFLFNSIVAGILGLFWVVVGLILAFMPAFFPVPGSLFDWNTRPLYQSELVSVSGSAILCITAAVFGLTFVPHAYRSWKLVDDYFVLTRDPWVRDVGLDGTARVLDGHKVAFVSTLLSLGAIGYSNAALYFFIPVAALCALIAGIKHIQGLFKLAAAFGRMQSNPAWYAAGTATNLPAPVPQVQTAYHRYQPSQFLYNPRSSQGTPPLDPTAGLVGIQREIAQRNQSFLQVIDADGQAIRLRQGEAMAEGVPNPPGVAPPPAQLAAPETRQAPTMAPQTATVIARNKCKYCFADLPSPNTGRCAGCGAALLPI